MPNWKGLRFQMIDSNGDIVAESRYFNMLLLLWKNIKPEIKETGAFTDTAKRKIFAPDELKKKYITLINGEFTRS